MKSMQCHLSNVRWQPQDNRNSLEHSHLLLVLIEIVVQKCTLTEFIVTVHIEEVTNDFSKIFVGSFA